MAMILTAVLMGACGSAEKGPAEAALKAAEQAIDAASSDVSKYMPEQARALTDGLAAAKEKFNKGDYKAALSEAQALATKAKDATSAVATKKSELAKNWQDMNAGMPRVMEAIQRRVDILSQSKKLPAGITSEQLAQAKSGLAEINSQWTEATAASTNGNLADAVAKGTAAKRKTAEVLAALNMPVPEALKS
ncbi:MAG TPA: hypothetical protein VGH16_14855 [Candidatus Binatia bacterium]